MRGSCPRSAPSAHEARPRCCPTQARPPHTHPPTLSQTRPHPATPHPLQVLRFWCIWDDRQSMYGDRRPYVLHYFLEDDTVEILELNENNSGRDPFPVFLRRTLLPKNTVRVGTTTTNKCVRARCCCMAGAARAGAGGRQAGLRLLQCRGRDVRPVRPCARAGTRRRSATRQLTSAWART